ncbi:hypothetical protein Plim_2972 [Planctopirus limnophila DSM 3776]|uniref:Uncharacterized protein n=1 Tax=Planctopirus limnophila (strain ATCC 43296 / DSM 3776 / IFAM 1008 / Mu 290) TaxID=521674 RepID=D5SS70_PLAL2|nr:hypothetical protein [Planctopirus limnophila]ADG68794.1 hypothetical protein Plim_2972 [Planctopirus limnophila DSM 3776]
MIASGSEDRLDDRDPVKTEVISQIFIYRKALRNTLWISSIAGVIHLLPSLYILTFVALHLINRGVASFSMTLLRRPEDGILLGYVTLMFACGAALVVCRFCFKSQPWNSLQVSYWSMAVLMSVMVLSPCCIMAPFFLFMFLEVRECYLAGRFLVNKGFDLRNLPDY